MGARCAAITDKVLFDLRDMAPLHNPLSLVCRHSAPAQICRLSHKGSATGTFRPLVPKDLRQQVFDHLRGCPPGNTGNPLPHRLQLGMERTVHGCHCMGERMSALPTGQGTPPRPGTSTAHTGADAPLGESVIWIMNSFRELAPPYPLPKASVCPSNLDPGGEGTLASWGGGGGVKSDDRPETPSF
jgi:hypothetical protein